MTVFNQKALCLMVIFSLHVLAGASSEPDQKNPQQSYPRALNLTLAMYQKPSKRVTRQKKEKLEKQLMTLQSGKSLLKKSKMAIQISSVLLFQILILATLI